MMNLQFWNTGTVLDTMTFLWLIEPKLKDIGQNLIPYGANQIWNLLPCEIKKSENLDSFKLEN